MHSSCFSAALDLSSAESDVLICSSILLGVNSGLQMSKVLWSHRGACRLKAKNKNKNKTKTQELGVTLQTTNSDKHTGTCPALHIPHCSLRKKHNLGKWKLQSFDDFKSEYPETFAKQAHMESELHSEHGSVTIPAEGFLEWLTI